MELQSIKLSGFRRFVKETELKTNGKLVAILGPNEAGKTSLLHAITHIADNSRISKYDLTRGKTISDDDVVITSRFRLDEDDLVAAHLNQPTWYVLRKKASGAQTYSFEPGVAFFPIRRALLTEGESDMLLLPTMLRESLGLGSLTFQVVPGLSKTSGINLPILARNGKGVAFALDFDKGGRELESKIISAGFDKESIFYVRGSSAADVQIEDFINPKILAYGCNQAFRELKSPKPEISISAFPTNGRLEAIAKHFDIRKRQDVPKILIAYHVLDYVIAHPGEPLVDAKKKKAFEGFANCVSAYLNRSPSEAQGASI